MASNQIKNLTNGNISWDWRNKHVADSYQDDSVGLSGSTQKISVTDFIDSSTTLLCAGPASLSEALQPLSGNLTGSTPNLAAGGIRLVPIGLAMGVNLQINRQSSKIFEVGSRLAYTVSGRVAGGISMSRALIDGANLLKVLYAGEVSDDASESLTPNGAGVYEKHVKFMTGNAAEREGINVPVIGSGNIALNLDSAFFNHPFGLAMIMRDQTNQQVSQHFFEGCVITSYSISISADMNVLTEGVSMEFTRIVPIITTTDVSLSTDSLRYDGELTDIPIARA